jgi:membrane protein YqaA with SNARE-associated domain
LRDLKPSPNTPQPAEEFDGRTLARRTVFGVVLLFLGAAAGAYFLQDDLTQAGIWFFDKYGLVGMFLGTMATDVFGIPVPVDVYLAAAITADKPVIPVLVTACTASVVSGSIAYGMGHYFHKLPLIGRLIKRYRAKGTAIFDRWGISAVAIAAWTPLPFSIVCWFAGTFRMPYRLFVLTTLHRIPRIIVYYYIIALGWFAGT